jgi:ectoine hydroxylase-related dioxygenase (phytanoyl-CoA dioxygenase family)
MSAVCNFDQKLEELHKGGYCVVENALDPELQDSFRTALYRVAEFDRTSGWMRAYGYGNDGNANQRIWNLISRDPIFCRLVEHELALQFIRAIIGWPALLSSTSANIVVCDDDNTAIHCDQCYVPEPWARPHGVNIAWCIDDFTSANGATLVAPASHLLNRCHRPDEVLPAFEPVEAPAGSMIVVDGRLWHTANRNTSGKPRAGIFNWYTLPIYLPQENWFLSVNPSLRQFGSETLQVLLGFRPGILGRVNGLAPLGAE